MTQPEIIKMDERTAREMVWGDVEGFEVVHSETTGQSRWAVDTMTVVKRLSDGKLFLMHWGKAATEYQEHQLPDEMIECVAVEKTVIRYVRVRDRSKEVAPRGLPPQH